MAPDGQTSCFFPRGHMRSNSAFLSRTQSTPPAYSIQPGTGYQLIPKKGGPALQGITRGTHQGCISSSTACTVGCGPLTQGGRWIDGRNSASVEVVVARYNEDASWCAPYNCTVYNKGSRPERISSTTRWRTLPNIGRESHTILSHLVQHYDSLADWTVFLQGDRGPHAGGALESMIT